MQKTKFELKRTVTQEECPWLNRDYEKGEIVYKFYERTYGCIRDNGTACSHIPNEYPFLNYQPLL